MMKPI